MPSRVINDLPLDADGHQFWVSAIDMSGNEGILDMQTTGYITFAPLEAPALSNVTNVYTSYLSILSLPPTQREPMFPVFGESMGYRTAPLVVLDIETSTNYFDHFEIEVDTVNTFDSGGQFSQNALGTYSSITGITTSIASTFHTVYNTLYYIRARVVDQLSRTSPWSTIVSETAGDTVAPNEVRSTDITLTRNGHAITLRIDRTTDTPPGEYVQADDHDYYEWWLNTSDSHPGGIGIRENDAEFFFGNKSGQTLYAFVAAVDRNGNRSQNYTTSVGSYPFLSSEYWTDTGNVTDLSGDSIIDVSDRGVEDENGNTIIDFTSGSGVTNYNGTLEGAINFGTGGALHLTDNTVAFAGSPIVGMEIIARGLKLYEDADNYLIMEKTDANTINVEIMGGLFRTGSSSSYLEIDSTGIKSYNTGTQRVEILNDGSGWLGAPGNFSWDTDGNVTVGGTITVTHIEAVTGTIAAFVIAANSITSTNIGLHSAGYSEGAEILVGHATVYASAEIGFKADGSGKVADGNFRWDTAGNVTMDGTFTSTATITGGTIQTAVSGARVVLNSSGIQGYDATTQRYHLNSDGSGWLGGATDFYWDSSGNVTIAGTVTVTNIAATTGTIAGWAIGSNEISYTSGNVRARLNSSGYISFGDPAPTSYGANQGAWLGYTAGDSDASLSLYNDANNYFAWDGSSLAIESANFSLSAAGNITATGGTIGGWIIGSDTLQSASDGNDRMELNQANFRLSFYDALDSEFIAVGVLGGVVKNDAAGTATAGSSTTLTDTSKARDWDVNELQGLTLVLTGGAGVGQSRTVSSNTADIITIVGTFSPSPNGTTIYEVRYNTNDYGFWAKNGDQLRIDGDLVYENGDWLIENNGSLKVFDGSGYEIIRLGTDTSEKGLFIYNTSGTQLAKYISDEIYIGTAGNFLQYTVAGGLIIEGDVTVSGTAYPAQPFDEDAILLWPLDSFPLDQSGNDNDGDSAYGTNVTYVDGGVGGGYTASFPNGTGNGDYLRAESTYAHQECTFTFWAKSSDIASNPVFHHNGTSTGGFHFNFSSSRPIIYLGASNYRYFDNTSEQDDGAWHFWCVYIAGASQSDINNSELWVDVSQVGVNATLASGAANAWGDLRLGYSFNGDLQDFRVYNRQLTEPEMTALYINPMSRTTTRITGDKITTGTIESTNWGSSAGSQFNLNDGTFYLGGSSSPDLSWDGATLSITGAITITSSSSGITYFSDAGPLVDATDLSDIPDGGGYYKMDANEQTGANRAYSGLDANNTVITAVVPATTPTQQTGLNLTADYMGYYNGASWMTFMDKSGNFYLGGTSGELQWNGTTLLLGGESQLVFGTRLVHGANILAPDIRLWHDTTTPASDDDMGYWTDGSNPYGGDDNNAVVNTLNPFGQRDLVWECTSTIGDSTDGGWGYNSFNIDRDLRYRYSLWVKRCGDINGGTYFGLRNSSTHTSALTADGSDSGVSNPYFASNFDLPNNYFFGTNNVTNGDMELTGNWTSYGSPVTNVRSATQSHGGTYSRQITVDGDRQGIYSDTFTLEAYQTYTLRLWLYGDGTEWLAYVNDGTEAFNVKQFGIESITPITGEWTEHVLHFQPKVRSTTARVYIVSDNSSGTLYIDDVWVETQLIANGDMEEDEGWAGVGTPSTHGLSTITEHGGTYSRRIIVNAAGEGTKTSKVRIASGTTTSTVVGKLVDSTASFTTDGTAVGDVIRNNTDDETTFVLAIDSATALSLYNNIFTSGESYTIRSNAGYIKLIGGYQYRATIWLYGNGATQWYASVEDGTNGYDFLETDNTTVLVPPAAWTKYVLDFEALNNTDSAWIQITSSGTSGTLYIDDVTLQETPWLLFIGYFHPDNYAGTESWGGMYHYKSGYKYTYKPFVDYKSRATTTGQMFRALFVSSELVLNQQYFYSPAIHVVDGSEPTLSALLSNSLDIGWNIEGTTNISKYLIESPTIRGGDFTNGNYVQIDETGIHGFGSSIETFKFDATDGSVTLKSSDSGQRLEINGTDNNLIFYGSSGEVLRIDDNVYGSDPGIKMYEDVNNNSIITQQYLQKWRF